MRRQSRDFPPPAHPGLRPLAWCPSRPLDLGASRGLQGPPPRRLGFPSQGCPRSPFPNGSSCWEVAPGISLLAGTTQEPRSLTPAPQGRPEGRASGRRCRAGFRRWAGLKAGERRGQSYPNSWEADAWDLGRRTCGTLVTHVPGNSRSPSAKAGGSASSRVLWFPERAGR